jgi:adenylate kinase
MDKRGGAKRKRSERLRKMLMEKQRELEKRIAEQIGEKVSEDIKAKLGSTLVISPQRRNFGTSTSGF